MEDQLQTLEANLQEIVKTIVWRITRNNPYLRWQEDEVESAALVGIAEAHQSYASDSPMSYIVWLRTKGYWATRDELRDSNITIRRVCTLRQKLKVIPEADLYHFGDKETTLLDGAPARDANPVELMMQEEELEDFRLLLTSLSAREREVVEHYFFHDHTMKETGVEIGITLAGVSLILQRALSHLRRKFAFNDKLIA